MQSDHFSVVPAVTTFVWTFSGAMSGGSRGLLASCIVFSAPDIVCGLWRWRYGWWVRGLEAATNYRKVRGGKKFDQTAGGETVAGIHLSPFPRS